MPKKLKNQKILYFKSMETVPLKETQGFAVTIHNSKIGLWKGGKLIGQCDRAIKSNSFSNLYSEAKVVYQFLSDGYPEKLPGYKSFK